MNKFFSLGVLMVVGMGAFAIATAHAMSATMATTTSVTAVATTTIATTTLPISTSTTTATTTVQDQVAVEKQVRDYFADVPAMIQIARCESNFRQFTDSGSVLHGGASRGMIGVFQFNEQMHATAARTLGFNLATLEGNIGYARAVYMQQGTTPWASCEPTPLLSDNSQLRIELLTKLIGLLQQLLAMKLAEK